MSYRDPLDAARARIAALEDLLDSPKFGFGAGVADEDGETLREMRNTLAEERATHDARESELGAERLTLQQRVDGLEQDVADETARRLAEVGLLRSKLEESERAIQNDRSLFEAEQTMQRAETEAQAARLRQQIVHKDTTIRELREEVRVHLGADRRAIRAYYAARVRVVGNELAEQGSLSRLLDKSLEDARVALANLPPVDVRDREAMVERELARRKVAVGERELERVKERVRRLESELERITAAEAQLAGA